MIFVPKAVAPRQITHRGPASHRGGAPLMPASMLLKHQEYNSLRTCFSSPSFHPRYRQNRYLRLHLVASQALSTAYMTNGFL